MINVGVIGSGAGTNRHVRALRKNPEVRITGRWTSYAKQKQIGFPSGVPEYGEPDRLLEDADGIVVTESGSSTYKLVVKALRQAKHVFMYPNLVRTANDALHFIKLAQEANAVLQVGYIGNIDPDSLAQMIPDNQGIIFIELHYYRSIGKSLSARSIHEALLINTQIIHSLVKSQVLSLKAKGMIMDSSKPEMISARLEYSNGCAVNLTCNLVAAKDDFHGTVVMSDRCVKFDLIEQKMTSWNIQRNKDSVENPLFIHNLALSHSDRLDEELRNFIQSSSTGSKHRYDDDCGFEPFLLTERILEKVKKSVIQYT